jgi:hypothetical protein
MFFGKDRALKAHLKHNIPANLWYTTSHNGVAMFAHARFVEEKLDSVRKNLKPGQVLRPINLGPAYRCEVMYFTDRTEFRTNEARTIPGIAGSMAEFNRLCDLFPTMVGPNLYVEHTDKGSSGYFGNIADPDDFVKVVEAVKRVIRTSVKEFG